MYFIPLQGKPKDNLIEIEKSWDDGSMKIVQRSVCRVTFRQFNRIQYNSKDGTLIPCMTTKPVTSEQKTKKHIEISTKRGHSEFYKFYCFPVSDIDGC